jgi:membrane associated rhomboid family serine protease
MRFRLKEKWVPVASSFCILLREFLGTSKSLAHGTGTYPRFSNVLGGNFSLVGVPSVGASGAIFGTIAVSPVPHFGD